MWPSHEYYRILHKQPTCKISIGVTRTWQELGSKTACDTNNGEVYMQSSPGKGSSLERCKQACEDTADCQSITFFDSGWCSHFSTSCTNLKTNKKAVTLRLVVGPGPAELPGGKAPPNIIFWWFGSANAAMLLVESSCVSCSEAFGQ